MLSTNKVLIFFLVTSLATAWGERNKTGDNKDDLMEFNFEWSTPNYKNKIKFYVPRRVVQTSHKKIKPVTGSNLERIAIMKELYVHEPDGKNIRLEVERFIEEDSEWLAPLTDALLKTSPDKSPRGLATHALHFVQSIPNSTNFSTGTSYLTPLGVLFENKGDCDSKSSLLASILSNLGIKWTLLDTPKHMVIGIAVPKQSNDAYYSGDLDYIVGETTIKNFPLGRWAPNQVDQRIKTIGPARPKPPKLID